MVVSPARVLSVNVGGVRTVDLDDRTITTAIWKSPVEGRVAVGGVNLSGDDQADRTVHGGVDKAVYAYAWEDTLWWQDQLGRALEPGSFGENLTTVGVDVTGAVIGERWAVGGAVLQVCQPRVPCATFAGFWGIPDLVKRFTARGAPGAYLRVHRSGEVAAGDAVTVVHRPAHGVTIGEVFRSATDESLLPRLLMAPELPEKVRAKAARRLAGTH